MQSPWAASSYVWQRVLKLYRQKGCHLAMYVQEGNFLERKPEPAPGCRRSIPDVPKRVQSMADCAGCFDYNSKSVRQVLPRQLRPRLVLL